jgi:hypothetical protein
VERLVDQFFDHPLDLMALEHEHDLARGQVDAVPFDAGFGEIEWRAIGDELSGSVLGFLFQVRDDC